MLNSKTIKVGDKVRVVTRETLRNGSKSPLWDFAGGYFSPALDYAGNIVTINQINRDSKGKIKSLKFTEDDASYLWAPHCFVTLPKTKVETKKTPVEKFKIGDRVICTGTQDGKNLDDLTGVIKAKNGCFFGDKFYTTKESSLKLDTASKAVKLLDGKYGVLVSNTIPYASTTGMKVISSSGVEQTLYAVIPDAKWVFLTGIDAYNSSQCFYVEVPAPVKPMTLVEIEKALGYKIKLIA